MAKPIPTAQEVAAKWKKNASGAESEYVSKVKQSTWKAEAVAGEDNYAKKVQEAISKKSRMKAIEKSSDAAWQGAVEAKSGRYSSGVSGAENDMASGMTPVLNDIKAGMATLSKRGPKGSSENYERSKKLGSALHDSAEKRKG